MLNSWSIPKLRAKQISIIECDWAEACCAMSARIIQCLSSNLYPSPLWSQHIETKNFSDRVPHLNYADSLVCEHYFSLWFGALDTSPSAECVKIANRIHVHSSQRYMFITSLSVEMLHF